jgi:hypothetical protein
MVRSPRFPVRFRAGIGRLFWGRLVPIGMRHAWERPDLPVLPPGWASLATYLPNMASRSDRDAVPRPCLVPHEHGELVTRDGILMA